MKWQLYYWRSRGELWITPVIGYSWPPEKGRAVWFSWLIWNWAFISNERYSYTHVHRASKDFLNPKRKDHCETSNK